MVEESKHIRFGSSANLIDPMAMTQAENLDPARDGVFARMRNAVVRYGPSAAIGSALGAGALAAKQLLSQNNNTTQLISMNTNATQLISTNTNATQNLSNQTDYDAIENPF